MTQEGICAQAGDCASRPVCGIGDRRLDLDASSDAVGLPGGWVASSVTGAPRHIEGRRLRRVASDLHAEESKPRRDLEAFFAASVLGVGA